MGYPGEPDEPGSDKFYAGCSYLLFVYLFIFLFLVCGLSGGMALVALVPLFILTFGLSHLIIKKSQSPTIRQVAMNYKYVVVLFGGLITAFFSVMYIVYLFSG